MTYHISQLVFDDIMNECIRDGFDEYLAMSDRDVAVDLVNAGTLDEFPEVNDVEAMLPYLAAWRKNF